MNLTLDGGTAQQRNWFSDAVAKALYDWDDLTANVTVTWPVEPSLEGHQESACTTTVGSESAVEMRRNLDDPEAWPEGKPFYQETVIHELAHVMCFTFLDATQREEMCPWFFKDRIGSGKVWGTADDLNPLDKPWEDRIIEAMAEILKDTFLEERYRASDNRTYWKLDPTRWQDFIDNFVPPASPGTENIITSVPLGTIHLPDAFVELWPPQSGVVYGVSWGLNMSGVDPSSGAKLRVRWSNPSDGPENGMQAGMIEYPFPEAGGAIDVTASLGLVGDHGTGGYDPSEPDAGKLAFNVSASPDFSTYTTLIAQLIDTGYGPAQVPTWAEVLLFSPATEGQEFPYKDSTVGSGGNDASVIRLGSSLMS